MMGLGEASWAVEGEGEHGLRLLGLGDFREKIKFAGNVLKK